MLRDIQNEATNQSGVFLQDYLGNVITTILLLNTLLRYKLNTPGSLAMLFKSTSASASGLGWLSDLPSSSLLFKCLVELSLRAR